VIAPGPPRPLRRYQADSIQDALREHNVDFLLGKRYLNATSLQTVMRPQ